MERVTVWVGMHILDETSAPNVTRDPALEKSGNPEPGAKVVRPNAARPNSQPGTAEIMRLAAENQMPLPSVS